MLLQSPADPENFVPTPGADEEIPVLARTEDQEVPPAVISPVKSPLLVTSASQYSQDSEATVTLSNPSQEQVNDLDLTDEKAPSTDQTKEVQTEKCIFLTEEEYDLLNDLDYDLDFGQDLDKLSTYFSSMVNQSPEIAPAEFERICKQIGAEKLLQVLYDCMSSERMSDERKNLTRLRAIVVIHIMMYSRSQRSNSFQVTLARTLQQFGISDQGLASLRNLGVAAHPRTVKSASQSAAKLHLSRFQIERTFSCVLHRRLS